MLDVATTESALETKRRELTTMMAEGRKVVAALTERQTALGRKIEEALDGIQRLQDQINAIDTVMGIVDRPGAAFQPARPVGPVLEVVTSVSDQQPTPARQQPFKPVSYLKCVAEGHRFLASRTVAGHVTCQRCRMRRKG